MIIAQRACLLTLCTVLLLSPWRGASADPAAKPALKGLISTGITVGEFTTSTEKSIAKNFPTLFQGKDGADLTGVFGGLVIQVAWSTLEPTQPAADEPVRLKTDLVEAVLAAVRAYNNHVAGLPSPNNRQIGIRLRVYAGCNTSPDWATKLDGKPVKIDAYYGSTADGTPIYENCITGQFWNRASNYAKAWRRFQKALAATYDSHPLIREVAIASCTSFSAEPFFLPYQKDAKDQGETKNDTTRKALSENGYKFEQYQDCLAKAVPDDYDGWHTTRLEFSFNAFSGVTSPPDDIAFSERVMRICRQTVGERCILSNHDLGVVPPSASTVLPIYALERKFGPNITFQTFKKSPADYEGTIRKGISLGAGAIEVWPDGYKTVEATTLQSWASMFKPQ